METPNNSLITPDARMGLAGAQPGAAGTATAGASLAGGAGADFGGFAQRMPMLNQFRSNPRVPLIVAVAIVVMVVAGLVMWSRQPDYRVLFSNLSDRDGGAIVAALQQGNIPYKLSDGGGAILVPAEQVHETRLRLASQGLPKSGSVGFELMDNQKFGISQFAEQINYQRALEGELQRTIESINAVRGARVHLAIPKPSVFVRDKEAPSASVFVDLYPGRVLDEGQVQAITRMVSSGVPDMPAKNVTIVDQDGNLLTQTASASGLDASQLKYVQQVEHNTQKRIDAILAPLFGAGNARSQVSADLNFSKVEQTAETYGPNGTPQQAAIRSQQTSTATEMSQGGASGVPGALSNQPPQPASAPSAAASGASGAAPMPIRRNSVPSASRASSVRAAANSVSGSTVGPPRRAARVRSANPAVFSLSTTPPAANPASRRRRASFSDRRQRCRSSAARAPRSASNGVSALSERVARAGSTGRESSPRARAARLAPSSPSSRAAIGPVSACNWPSRVMPSAASRRSIAGPMPGNSATGSPARSCAVSSPSTAKPRGLSHPAASFARSRLRAKPIETVTPTSCSTRRAKRASTAAGGAPCSASVPDRSSTASSIESGCTSGVRSRIRSRIRRAAAA